MSSGADSFLKKALGEDFFQSLEKFELYKPGTRTVIDHEEIKTALKIVPRTIMSLLISELTPMEIGETKEINLPIPNAMTRINKLERDVYSGDIEQDNKKLVDFKYRSIPGIGLVIMSAFELYNVDDLDKEPSHDISEDITANIQKIIDERLALHSLVENIVDKRIAQKDAVEQLIVGKIEENIIKPLIEIEKHEPTKVAKKGSPLKDFLDNRKSKLKKNEYSITLLKGETANCPDCGQNVFDGTKINTCVCYGDSGKVFLRKTENGLKVRFGKNWDIDSIEMLLEVLRKKRG